MTSAIMPALFIGHGSPMNAMSDNSFTRTWRELGQTLPKPEAIVCISAHWQTRGTRVMADSHPKTTHDFYGFPPALYQVNYPAPGSSKLAQRLISLISTQDVETDYAWGFDHGAWGVLKVMYPAADIPVVQLSMDATLAPAFHYQLAKQLAPLRQEKVLILGSGNIVHNLRHLSNDADAPAHAWASRFETRILRLIQDRDHEALCSPEQLPEGADLEAIDEAYADARLAVNSGEHYLPLLYILALQQNNDQVRLLNQGMVSSAISMTSVLLEHAE